MAARDQVEQLLSRTLAELDELELYVENTQKVWRLVQELAGDTTWPGANLQRLQSGDAGLILAAPAAQVSRLDVQWLAARATEYTGRYLAESALQQSLAAFEAFFADLLTAWLTAYPASLGKRQFEFQLLIDAADLADATGRVIAAEVGGLLYKTLAEQFEYLRSRAGIGPLPADQLAALAEAKATRNVLVHNRGVVNAQYLTLAGRKSRYALGERVEVPGPYRRQVWELVRQLVTDLSDAALTKLPPPPAAG